MEHLLKVYQVPEIKRHHKYLVFHQFRVLLHHAEDASRQFGQSCRFGRHIQSAAAHSDQIPQTRAQRLGQRFRFSVFMVGDISFGSVIGCRDVLPVRFRRLFVKLNWFQGLPIDISFLVAFMLISLVSQLLILC